MLRRTPPNIPRSIMLRTSLILQSGESEGSAEEDDAELEAAAVLGDPSHL